MPSAGDHVVKRLVAYGRSLLAWPVVSIGIAIVLFVVTSLVDARVRGPSALVEPTAFSFLVFAGSPEAARSVLAAIATMWATITGVVYTVTLVTLQLSATKYTAEVIPQFEKDRTNRFVLALFTGTVAYSLLVLKTVRVEQPDPFAPAVGVNVAVLLALAALVALAVFVANLTSYMRPKRFVNDLAASVVEQAAKRYEEDARAGGEPFRERPDAPGDATRHKVRSDGSGYVASLDVAAIAKAVRDLPEGTVVTVRAPPGTELREGTVMFEIQAPSDHPEDDLERRASDLRSAVSVLPTRTLEGDPLLGVETIGDIGVSTVSAPTDTAVASRCLHALMHIARWEAERPAPPRGVTIDGVHVDLQHEAVTTSVLRECRQIHDAALHQGFWTLTDDVVDEALSLLDTLADENRRGRWMQVSAFAEQALTDALRANLNDDALAAAVRRFGDLEDRLRGDGRLNAAEDVRLVVEEAFAHARRPREEGPDVRASAALDALRAHR